jgi:hypothetical protein
VDSRPLRNDGLQQTNTQVDPTIPAQQVMRLGLYLAQGKYQMIAGQQAGAFHVARDDHGHGTNVDLGCIAVSDVLHPSYPSFSTTSIHIRAHQHNSRAKSEVAYWDRKQTSRIVFEFRGCAVRTLACWLRSAEKLHNSQLSSTVFSRTMTEHGWAPVLLGSIGTRLVREAMP